MAHGRRRSGGSALLWLARSFRCAVRHWWVLIAVASPAEREVTDRRITTICENGFEGEVSGSTAACLRSERQWTQLKAVVTRLVAWSHTRTTPATCSPSYS